MQPQGWIGLLALVMLHACDSDNPSGAPYTAAGGTANAGTDGTPSDGANGRASGGSSGSGGYAGQAGSDVRDAGSGGAGRAPDAASAGGDGGDVGRDAGSGGRGAAGTGGASGTGGSQHADAGTSDAHEGGPARESGAVDGNPPALREFAYVATRFGGVTACSVEASSGKLNPVGAAINPTGTAIALAVHSTQKFVYVADENKHIDTYRIAPDGTLPAQRDSSVDTPDMLISLALDPKGRFAYASSQQASAVYAFTVNSGNGKLDAVGDPVVVGTAATPTGAEFIAVEPTGQYLYVSGGFEAGVAGYAIDQSTGQLDELDGSPFGKSGLPDGDIVFGGAIAFEPTGHFLYGVGGGMLNAFAIDSSGKLSLVTGSPFSTEVRSDPNAPNIAVDPHGEFVYTTEFLFHDHISGFRIDPVTGALTEVPGSPIAGTASYSVAIDPTGRFVYVGIDAPQVGGYSVKRSNGALEEIQGQPFPLGGLESKIAFATIP